MNDTIDPIPMDELRYRLQVLYAPSMRAPATWRGIRHVLDQLEAMGVETTAQLTTDAVARFIAARPATESPNTTYGLLARLRCVCNYAAAEGLVRVSPFAIRRNWGVRKVVTPARRHLSMEEIARVLDLMRRDIPRKKGWARWRAWRLYALASLVAYTGLRKMEALRLRVEDIDLEAKVLLVVPRVGSRLKTAASAAPVPLPDALVIVLRQWLPHCQSEWCFPNATHNGPWVGGSSGYRPLDRMRRLGERAGVPGFNFQVLRHSFATHCELWGLPETMIARILRHTSTRTSRDHYRHADLANMRAVVAGIGFGAAPPAEGLQP